MFPDYLYVSYDYKFQITSNDLLKGSIHLVKDGNVLLDSNFINNLNYSLRITQAQDPVMQLF